LLALVMVPLAYVHALSRVPAQRQPPPTDPTLPILIA
jgi:hypothetical protein